MIIFNCPGLSPNLVQNTNRSGKVISNWQENPGNCKIKNEYPNLDEAKCEPWEPKNVVKSCLKAEPIYDLNIN